MIQRSSPMSTGNLPTAAGTASLKRIIYTHVWASRISTDTVLLLTHWAVGPSRCVTRCAESKCTKMAVILTVLQLIYGKAGAREKFEELTAHLIRSERPDTERIRIVHGDGGIDAHEGGLSD